jgi:hypothetical protein
MSDGSIRMHFSLTYHDAFLPCEGHRHDSSVFEFRSISFILVFKVALIATGLVKTPLTRDIFSGKAETLPAAATPLLTTGAGLGSRINKLKRA